MKTPPADAARFLRRLPGDDFAPPAADVDAVVVGTLRSADGQANAFAAEVGAFAASFWELAPAARRKRWTDLNARAFGPATAWLVELERGLDVTPVPQKDAAANEVSGLARELFTLPPRARAARLRAWLLADNRRDSVWTAGVRTVLRTDLPLAELDARLFDWFSLSTLPAPVPAFEVTVVGVKFNPATGERSATPSRTAFGCGGWGLGLFAVVTILRLVFSGGGTNRSDSLVAPMPSPGLYFQTTAIPTHRDGSPVDKPFTGSEVVKFFEYQRAVETGAVRPSTPKPPRYDRWVELGRPTSVTAP